MYEFNDALADIESFLDEIMKRFLDGKNNLEDLLKAQAKGGELEKRQIAKAFVEYKLKPNNSIINDIFLLMDPEENKKISVDTFVRFLETHFKDNGQDLKKSMLIEIKPEVRYKEIIEGLQEHAEGKDMTVKEYFSDRGMQKSDQLMGQGDFVFAMEEVFQDGSDRKTWTLIKELRNTFIKDKRTGKVSIKKLLEIKETFDGKSGKGRNRNKQKNYKHWIKYIKKQADLQKESLKRLLKAQDMSTRNIITRWNFSKVLTKLKIDSDQVKEVMSALDDVLDPEGTGKFNCSPFFEVDFKEQYKKKFRPPSKKQLSDIHDTLKDMAIFAEDMKIDLIKEFKKSDHDLEEFLPKKIFEKVLKKLEFSLNDDITEIEKLFSNPGDDNIFYIEFSNTVYNAGSDDNKMKKIDTEYIGLLLKELYENQFRSYSSW